jgi:hypothetical protein
MTLTKDDHAAHDCKDEGTADSDANDVCREKCVLFSRVQEGVHFVVMDVRKEEKGVFGIYVPKKCWVP